MSARFATEGAYTLYGGYRFYRWLGFIGLVQNPRTSYQEAVIGVGTTFGSTTQNVLLGLAAANASDAPYAQVYVLPSITWGRWLLDGTIEGYLPLVTRGSAQLSATPLNMLYGPTTGLKVGVSYVGSGQRQLFPSHAVGPSLRVGIPRGTIAIDALRAVALARHELRVTALVAW